MSSSTKSRKISEFAALFIAIIAQCLSVMNFVMAQKSEVSDGADMQYMIFLGTNDKNTNEPVFSHEEARAKAEEILLNRFGGYTIQEATGGWDDDGTLYREYTLVICLSDTTIEEVRAAADEMLRVFNQKSVLIQSNETKTEFYYQ